MRKIFLYLLFFIFLGCPPPSNFIYFNYQGKSKDHIQVKVEDPKYKVDISAFGGLGEGKKQMIYTLVIGLEIKSIIPNLNIKFDSEKPETYVGGYLMEYIHSDSTSYKYVNDYSTFFRLVYKYDFTKIDTTQRIYQNDQNQVRLMLHDCLLINGIALEIDTLIGRDRKPFYFHAEF